MPDVELPAGRIAYEDTGGTGPVLVLSHGLIMDASVWRHVVADLRGDFRCIAPTLPLGSHRTPMRPGADRSMRGVAGILGDLLDALDLRDVTLAINDWGGPLLLVEDARGERIARLVITSCEAFDNVPPGLPGKVAALAGALPGGINAAVQPLRLRPLRRLPLVHGWMSKRPVPDDVFDHWLEPVLAQRAIRRDLRAYVRSVKQGRRDLTAATEALRGFERPALVAWASEDRVMPPDHAHRLVELMPDARLVEIADSYTLIPEDQPVALARAIRQFVAETAAASAEPRGQLT